MTAWPLLRRSGRERADDSADSGHCRRPKFRGVGFRQMAGELCHQLSACPGHKSCIYQCGFSQCGRVTILPQASCELGLIISQFTSLYLSHSLPPSLPYLLSFFFYHYPSQTNRIHSVLLTSDRGCSMFSIAWQCLLLAASAAWQHRQFTVLL